MLRTQIYLEEDELQTLRFISSKEKKTVSELIRKAIDQIYLVKKKDTFEADLDTIAGLWSDREFETDAYIRTLRCGKRQNI